MKYKKLTATILSVIFIATLWEFIAWKVDYPAIFPPLKELFRQLFLLFTTSSFYKALAHTILRGLAGICIAIITAFLFGTLAAFSTFWHSFLQPGIVILRSVPVISFVLLALLWFSPTQLPVFIAIVTVFPITWQSVVSSLKQTDTKLLEMAEVFGKNPLNRFLTIYLPASKKLIYDGISTAMGFGWRAIIIGEVLSQPIHGIGTGMKEAQAFIQVPKLMAWTVVAISISYLFEILLRLIRKVKIKKHYPSPLPFNLNNVNETSIIREINIIALHKAFNNNVLYSDYNNIFTSRAIHCLKGISGKGKTTLLRMISQLDTDYRGQINYPSSYRLSYSFQDIRLLPWLTAKENIFYVFNKKLTDNQTASNITAYLLAEMGLTEHADKYPHQLSGGLQQRINLARALAVRADILLLDEPLTGLNNELKADIIDLTQKWINTYHPVTIWATHENIESPEMNIINEVI